MKKSVGILCLLCFVSLFSFVGAIGGNMGNFDLGSVSSGMGDMDFDTILKKALAAADLAIDKALGSIDLPVEVHQKLSTVRTQRDKAMSGISISDYVSGVGSSPGFGSGMGLGIGSNIGSGVDIQALIKDALSKSDVSLDSVLNSPDIPDIVRESISGSRLKRDNSLRNFGQLSDSEIGAIGDRVINDYDSSVDSALGDLEVSEIVREKVRGVRNVRTSDLSGSSNSDALAQVKFNTIRDDAIAQADAVVDRTLSELSVSDEIRLSVSNSRLVRDEELEGFNRSRYNLAVQKHQSEVINSTKNGGYVKVSGVEKERMGGGYKRGVVGENAKEAVQNMRIKMKNGRDFEVKIMPEVASNKAISRLGLKICNVSNDCTLQFKEVGSGDDLRIAYHLRAKKEGRFLWLFKTKMDVESEVDAGTGEVLKSKKPWWAILVNE